jgi:hypothetical protein
MTDEDAGRFGISAGTRAVFVENEQGMTDYSGPVGRLPWRPAGYIFGRRGERIRARCA